MELRGRVRRDLDRERAGRILRVIAGDGERADAAARRHGAAAEVEEIAANTAMAYQQPRIADKDIAGDARTGMRRIADHQRAPPHGPEDDRATRIGVDSIQCDVADTVFAKRA